MKKKTSKRTPLSPRARRLLIASIAVVLVAVLVLGTVLLLVPKNPAMTYEGVSISREMYSFWYSIYKTKFIVAHGQSGALDTEAGWNSQSTVPGKTWGELLDEEIEQAIKQKLVAAVLYDKLGRSMSVSQRDMIDSYYEDMLEYAANGDKEVLEQLAEKYGTTKSAIKKCAALDIKAELYYNYLYNNNGAAMTPEELNRYVRNRYIRFYVLAIYEDYEWVLKDDGSAEKIELTEPEKAARVTLDNELAEYLPHGEKANEMTDARFMEYLDGHSDDVYHNVYPLGFYLSSFNSLPMLDEKIIDEAMKLDPGELGCAETEDAIYYVRAYDVGVAPYLDESTNDFFFGDDINFYVYAAKAVLAERTLAEVDKVTVHSENTDGISVKTLPRNTDFKFCSMK